MSRRPPPKPPAPQSGEEDEPQEQRGAPAPLARAIGRTRYVVLLAVGAVLLVAMALFLFGTFLAVQRLWHAGSAAVGGELNSAQLTVEFLEVVSVMLKAVVFYLIGVGLYSLFIAPLNLTAVLGVETLSDLEVKVVSVVIVIMAVTFLEHFIAWKEPEQLLRFAGALALATVPLVAFQWHAHRVKEDQRSHAPDTQVRAQRRLFDEDHETRDVHRDEEDGSAGPRR